MFYEVLSHSRGIVNIYEDTIERYITNDNRAKSATHCADKAVFFSSSSSFFFNTTQRTLQTHKHTRTECKRTMTRAFSFFFLFLPVIQSTNSAELFFLLFLIDIWHFSLSLSSSQTILQIDLCVLRMLKALFVVYVRFYYLSELKIPQFLLSVLFYWESVNNMFLH